MLEIDKFNKIIVANWKLNGSLQFIDEYLNDLESIQIDKGTCCVLCPPAVYLHYCSLKNSNFYLGSQDCSIFDKGAYTGEISAPMLSELKCQFSIIGHSERRELFKQTNEEVRIKAEILIKNNINPIICVGETYDDKKKGATKDILYEQIKNSSPRTELNDTIIIAYEPIWAIGTGLVPTLEEINNINLFLKKELNNCKVLYGGSVKRSNAQDIKDLDSVDGLLVGGSSLNSSEFIEILNA